MRLVELGGGANPHSRAEVVLDLRHPLNAPRQDIGADTWCDNHGPIPDNSVEAIYASHVLEHVDKGAPILHVMAEAWRVLVPGGTFTIKVPAAGYDGRLVADWRVYAVFPRKAPFKGSHTDFSYFTVG